MSSEADVKFEIGHVLFIDIVGYSKLLIHEQTEQLQKLREIARATEQFRAAQAEGKLLRLPTGDGGALVFSDSPETPVACALEISKALKNHPELRVRMGIHSGPVNEVTDLNEQANIAGAGINIAQRVMDCGDAVHILLSRHVADDLETYPRWQPCLHNLGEFEVKHGARIGIVNLYDDQIGNPQLPKTFQELKKHRSRVRRAEAAIALLVLAAVVAAFIFVLRKPTRALLGIAEKSIAVLPFENLSEDKANAYFAEGIQDEILTRLSKIADLKVISRTSTQHYKSAPENLREIAKQLGVAHILEGSVQKSGDAVRVNVQLIKAANDSHLWAETFDRKLTEIFSDESEVAREAAETALTLQPTLGEAVWAKGYYHYACLKDYDSAVRYFEEAHQLLPNNSRIPESLAYVARRRGQWDRSESYFNEAERLDPRNVNLLIQHALSYVVRRRFPEALRKLDQVLNIIPDDVNILTLKAGIAQAEGDLPRAAALLAPLHPPAEDPQTLEPQVYQAILERRPAQITPRLREILAKSDPALGYFNSELRFYLGWAQEVAGEHVAAQETWRQARSELESFLKEQPENHFLIGDLALTNMGLGDKGDTLALAERAMAAVPIEKDALFGPIPLEILARVAAQMGEPNRAIAALEKLL